MRDVTCARTAAGAVECDVERRHRHHSPDGFEVGYGGSGPADLALNILADVLPRPAGDPGVKLWDGSRVASEAWEHTSPRHA